MLRLAVTAAFLALAGGVIRAAFLLGADTPRGNVLINLGTEIVGIVLTVAVVEWFFERRRHVARGRQLAWDTMHATENAVWVWQGGPRQMESDEILGVLRAVGEDDPLPDFTDSLLLNLGTRSRRLLTNEATAVGAVPGFMAALEHFGRLAAIRDGRATWPARKVADILEAGVEELARGLGQPTERHLASLIRYRDPSLAGQERRHFGDRDAAGSWRRGGSEPHLPG